MSSVGDFASLTNDPFQGLPKEAQDLGGLLTGFLGPAALFGKALGDYGKALGGTASPTSLTGGEKPAEAIGRVASLEPQIESSEMIGPLRRRSMLGGAQSLTTRFGAG